MPTAPRVDAPEQAGFEVERFDFAGPDRLEVVGRWFGVRGRRFVRPVLTVEVAGSRRRIVALLEHKPWVAADGERWIAAFPWEGAREGAGEAELEVGSLTVTLPAPGDRAPASGLSNQPSRRPVPVAPAQHDAATRAGARPSSPGRKPAAPPLRKDTTRRGALAGDPTSALERGLGAARAEAQRLRERHEAEAERLHAEVRRASERAEAAEAELEAAHTEISRLRAAEEALREEVDSHRDGDSSLRAETDQLRAAATDARDAAAEAHAELARVTEAEAARRAELEQAQAETARAAEAADAAREELRKLKRGNGSARKELEKAREAEAAAREETRALRIAEAAALAELERLGGTRPAAPGPAGTGAAGTGELQRLLEGERVEREQLAAQIEDLRRHMQQQPAAPSKAATPPPAGPPRSLGTASARALAVVGIVVVIVAALVLLIAGGIL